MSNTQQERTGPESLLENWIKTSTNFWGSMVSMWPDMLDNNWASAAKTSAEKPGRSRTQESWENAFKNWLKLSSVMAKPEAMEALSKGTQALPDILLKLIQTGWEGFFHLQQQGLERSGKIGKTTEAYKFENLDQDAFRAWSELYEKEFSQFLNVPQLGLTRFYQERVGRAVDKFNVLQADMAEFLHIFYLPMEKSFKVLQEKVATLAEEGDLPADTKDVYRLWIKILEGHYMTLFKSAEYTQALNKTIDSLEEFMVAREDVLLDVLKMYPVATNKDMDELYKEIYLLKKRVRTLEKEKKSKA
jgi:hypothetical protein